MPACLNATAWAAEYRTYRGWRVYSQGHQDSALSSLFYTSPLGTTNQDNPEDLQCLKTW